MRTMNGQSLPSTTCLIGKTENDDEITNLIKKIKEEKESKNYILELFTLVKKRKIDFDNLKNMFTESEFLNVKNSWKLFNENSKAEDKIFTNSISSINNVISNVETKLNTVNNNLQVITNVKPLTDDPTSRLNHYRSILHNLNKEKSVNKEITNKIVKIFF